MSCITCPISGTVICGNPPNFEDCPEFDQVNAPDVLASEATLAEESTEQRCPEGWCWGGTFTLDNRKHTLWRQRDGDGVAISEYRGWHERKCEHC